MNLQETAFLDYKLLLQKLQRDNKDTAYDIFVLLNNVDIFVLLNNDICIAE